MLVFLEPQMHIAGLDSSLFFPQIQNRRSAIAVQGDRNCRINLEKSISPQDSAILPFWIL